MLYDKDIIGIIATILMSIIVIIPMISVAYSIIQHEYHSGNSNDICSIQHEYHGNKAIDVCIILYESLELLP